MKGKKLDRLLLNGAILSYFLMSLSIVLMSQETAQVLPGVLFWGGLAGGAVLMALLRIRLRSVIAADRGDHEKKRRPQNGLFRFRSNGPAVIADLAMTASTAAMILVVTYTKGAGIWCYLLIASTLFTFCLHCIYNGRIFFHVKNQTRLRQKPEQKKENIPEKGEGEL